MIIYYGSDIIEKEPFIRKTKYTKDFSWGFYCTIFKEQAKKCSTRKDGHGYINIFEYIPNNHLNILTFDSVNEEWLDFIANCRSGKTHHYDVVEGPMTDDTIYNYVEDYLDRIMSKEEFFTLAKFRHPTHQISFHSISALECLTYIESKEVTSNEQE